MLDALAKYEHRGRENMLHVLILRAARQLSAPDTDQACTEAGPVRSTRRDTPRKRRGASQ